MHLVDERDDSAFGSLDLGQHGLKALFELSPILRAGDEARHVDGNDALVLEAFGYVAVNDALRKAFDDRRLADSWFSDQNRVVLGPA